MGVWCGHRFDQSGGRTILHWVNHAIGIGIEIDYCIEIGIEIGIENGDGFAQQQLGLRDHGVASSGCCAIWRRACTNTSGGWPPLIRCLWLMTKAGTELTPARW